MSAQISQFKKTASTPESGPKRILLLDDDADLVHSLKQLLESHSFVVSAECSSALAAAGFPIKASGDLVVTTVSSGVEGLNEVMKVDFDAIICDMMMPRMAGDMFYLAVTKMKPHLSERFLFITGHSKDAKISEFLKKTRRLVLFKPVPIHDLITTISFMLKQAARGSRRGI